MRGSLIHIAIFAIVATMLSISSLSAQQLPERRLVRQGNEQFERRNFNNSLNRYNEALEHAPYSYEAQYNRANAYLQKMLANPQDSTLNSVTSNRYFEQIANNKSLTLEQRGEVLRNLGESLFLQEEYEAALNAFRESLKLNPNDAETKKNYVLTKRIVDQKRNMEQQQNQQNQQNQQDQQNQQQNNNQNKNQDNDNNNDQNKDNNQNNQNQENDKNKDNNQNQDQNNDKGQNKNEDQNKDEDKDQGNNDNKPNNGSNGSGEKQHKELSHEQERMLDVIQGEEDKTQDKIKDAERGTIVYGKKNW